MTNKKRIGIAIMLLFAYEAMAKVETRKAIKKGVKDFLSLDTEDDKP